MFGEFFIIFAFLLAIFLAFLLAIFALMGWVAERWDERSGE